MSIPSITYLPSTNFTDPNSECRYAVGQKRITDTSGIGDCTGIFDRSPVYVITLVTVFVTFGFVPT